MSISKETVKPSSMKIATVVGGVALATSLFPNTAEASQPKRTLIQSIEQNTENNVATERPVHFLAGKLIIRKTGRDPSCQGRLIVTETPILNPLIVEKANTGFSSRDNFASSSYFYGYIERDKILRDPEVTFTEFNGVNMKLVVTPIEGRVEHTVIFMNDGHGDVDYSAGYANMRTNFPYFSANGRPLLIADVTRKAVVTP